MKLCPAFYSASGPGAPMSRDLRTFAVLHEVTHSAGVGIDIAYSSSRLFDLLELGDAQNNADSHVVLILTLARAGRVLASRRTAPPSDRIAFPRPDGTADPGRETAARRALGYAGSWLNYAAFWTASLYDWEASSLSGWSSFGGLGQAMAEIYAPLFQLQRPGLATTPTLDAAESAKVTAFQAEVAGRGFPLPPIGPRATTQDRTRVAAVYDRFARLYEGTKQDLTVGPAATGDGQWDPAPGLPGVGANILLPTAFFGEGRPQQVRRVVRLAARALADIPSHWTEAYVEAADGVRRYRGLGPS